MDTPYYCIKVVLEDFSMFIEKTPLLDSLFNRVAGQAFIKLH